MFNDIKKKLYFKKMNLLTYQGLKDKKIVPFDDEFYEKMSHTYFNGIPISMHIKYLKPFSPLPGGCYDRSLLMFFCFSNALLCRGDQKDLEFRYCKEDAGHGWIEIGEYVYDPSLLKKFEKNLYYSIYEPTNVTKHTISEYCSNPENKKIYDDITKVTIHDLQSSGIKRMNLMVNIPLINAIAEKSGNQDFINDLNKHLSLINYDEQQITKRLNLSIKK